jgi:TrmH family RNA methyltransferase
MPEDASQPRRPSAPGVDPLLRRFVIVLHEPQDVVNIAGCMRAMANMGLGRLRLVRPAEYDEYRIRGIAHNTAEILAGVALFDTLPDALADVTHVAGTTARRRRSRFVWQHPREAAPELAALAADGDVALVFGREDVGLSNEDIDLCDRLLTIPTDPGHHSLNLAQAVLVVVYELRLAVLGEGGPLPRPRRSAPPATWAQHQMLFQETEAALDGLDFFKTREPPALMRTLRALARRARLDAREANLLRAIAIEVQKALGLRDSRHRR